jgi:hypothetical protein
MLARFRRPITILAALALSMSLAAPVVAQGASFEIQIQRKATLAAHDTRVDVHATYRCTFPDGGLHEPEEFVNSNFSMSATQFQSRQRVVSGASGASAQMLTCDGEWQAGIFGVEGGPWKPGKATFHFYVNFTDAVSHEVFHMEVPDTTINIAAEKPAKGPKLQFSTYLMDGDTPLAGSPEWGFVLATGGDPGTVHQVGTTGTVASPGIPDGPYPFYLQADPDQQAELTAYFEAKDWSQVIDNDQRCDVEEGIDCFTEQDLLDQSAREVAGDAPYFELIVGLGNGWFLQDGFHQALTIDPPMYGVAFDDDFPPGTYTFVGHLVGTNGSTLDYSITLTIERV